MARIKSIQLWCLLFCLALLPSIAGAEPPGNASNWIMTFNDEFDGASLDLVKWKTTYIWGGRTNNDELEWYVDDADQHIVSEGTLKLIAKKESVSGHSYTSGLISSHASFSQTYGYWEGRMKLPKGKGLWPALWTLPTPYDWPPEIDIMENLGNQTTKVYMTNHWGTDQSHQQYSTSYTGSDFSAGFHVFGIEWTDSAIVWYVDGVQRARSTSGIPSGKMHMIANLAVGGSWPGSPDSSTVFPAQLEIDYIRVYQQADSPPTPSSPPASPKGLRTVP
jgi:beta-glucanase (GH16 family)